MSAHKEIIVNYLKSTYPGLQGVWLFGSAVEDAETAEDFDIAFMTDRKTAALERFDQAGDLGRLLHKDVDLLDMREISTVMQFQVISKGERLYAAENNDMEAFSTLVYSMYYQLNEDRAEIIRTVQEDGAVYGRRSS